MVSLVTCYRLNDLGFKSWQVQDMFSSLTVSRLTLGPTQASTQGIVWFFPVHKGAKDMKLTKHIHLVPRLKMKGVMPLLPLYASWNGQGQHHLVLYLLSY
jgi:hypothetical protein